MSDAELIRKLSATLQSFQGRCSRLKSTAMLMGTARDSSTVRADVELLWKGEETQRLLKETRRLMNSQIAHRSNLRAQFERLQRQAQALLKEWAELNRVVTQRTRQLALLPQASDPMVDGTIDHPDAPNLDKILAAIEDSAVEVDRTLVEERNNDLQLLKDDLTELKDVFVDTAQIIVEQGDEMEHGATHIVRTRAAVDKTVDHSARARQRSKGKRCYCCLLICLIFTILLAAAAVVTVYFLTDGSWDIVGWFKKNVLHEHPNPAHSLAPAHQQLVN